MIAARKESTQAAAHCARKKTAVQLLRQGDPFGWKGNPVGRRIEDDKESCGVGREKNASAHGGQPGRGRYVMAGSGQARSHGTRKEGVNARGLRSGNRRSRLWSEFGAACGGRNGLESSAPLRCRASL